MFEDSEDVDLLNDLSVWELRMCSVKGAEVLKEKQEKKQRQEGWELPMLSLAI